MTKWLWQKPCEMPWIAVELKEERRRVEVWTRAVGGRMEVSVRDEGVGIPTQALPPLFERFRHVDRERMEQQGVGLGLAIAHELVRLHGGDITVDSERGQGSTFTIRLPAVDGKSPDGQGEFGE